MQLINRILGFAVSRMFGLRVTTGVREGNKFGIQMLSLNEQTMNTPNNLLVLKAAFTRTETD